MADHPLLQKIKNDIDAIATDETLDDSARLDILEEVKDHLDEQIEDLDDEEVDDELEDDDEEDDDEDDEDELEDI